MSEQDSDTKPPRAEGAEEMESVEKAEAPTTPEFDKEMERRILWKLDTRCVIFVASEEKRQLSPPRSASRERRGVWVMRPGN